MSFANFKVLGISIDIGNQVYHDDGFVDSIEEHTKMLRKIYGLYPLDDFSNKLGVVGKHFQVDNIHHIFYLDSFKKANIHTRAHEETHVVDSVGCLDVLSDRLLEEQGVNIDFSKIDNTEVKAELGALYTLYSRGISPLFYKRFQKLFKTARKIYEDSRV